MSERDSPQTLLRVVSLPGAIALGLGSILGTGIFVSVGVAAGKAGDAVLLAIALAALVALCNGLSSAWLAARHPVSGGSYEYGYRELTPALGFTAGVTFLIAKSASAATAALGFAAYALALFGIAHVAARVAVALGLVVVVTALTASGMRRSNRVNASIVAVTIAGLGAFVIAAAGRFSLGETLSKGLAAPSTASGAWAGVLEATALMFVAYTGYGRIATLGEEVQRPERTIPRAIAITLALSLALYLGVTGAAVSVIGASGLAATLESGVAPLQVAARALDTPAVTVAIDLAAIAAMGGVALNLMLGLSRMVLAMARRGDLPRGLAQVDARRGTPARATLAVAVLVGALACTGSIAVSWSISAFTVLVYYAVANLAALRMERAGRRWHRLATSCLGLVASVALAFWVERAIWIGGSLAIVAALALRRVSRRPLSRA